MNFGELAGAYSGNHSGGGSDSESDHQVKSLMELQQQGIPGYGLYRSHYNNPGGNHDPGFPGNRGHLGGYPFPPMPGQNSYGYAHLGYPSSQSPGPREGKVLITHLGAGALTRADSIPESKLLIPKWRLFAITAILPIIYSTWSKLV